MANLSKRRAWIVGMLLLGGVTLYFLLRASPLEVETVRVGQGPLQVTVDEGGETRAHDRFVVAAPIPGRPLRMQWEEGDEVRENAIVAEIQPLPLNQQQREEALARIEAAEATKRQRDARLAHAREDYAQTQRDLSRAETLGKEKVLSVQALEQARNLETTSAQEFDAARFSALAAASEVKVARAGLLGMDLNNEAQKVISLCSPISGRVLRLVEKSERVVQAGTPLLTLGDPGKIEIVTDVLTTDAVHIQRGAPVYVEGCGGDHPLRAKVRLVEPSGFTKISALGVEEKRLVPVIGTGFVLRPSDLNFVVQRTLGEGTNSLGLGTRCGSSHRQCLAPPPDWRAYSALHAIRVLCHPGGPSNFRRDGCFHWSDNSRHHLRSGQISSRRESTWASGFRSVLG